MTNYVSLDEIKKILKDKLQIENPTYSDKQIKEYVDNAMALIKNANEENTKRNTPKFLNEDENINKINTWRQGKFVDSYKYKNLTFEDKQHANFEESFLVRPSSMGNPICKTLDPRDSKWIAKRLNIVASIESILSDMNDPIRFTELVKRIFENER